MGIKLLHKWCVFSGRELRSMGFFLCVYYGCFTGGDGSEDIPLVWHWVCSGVSVVPTSAIIYGIICPLKFTVV
jgi:hypothetical protein